MRLNNVRRALSRRPLPPRAQPRSPSRSVPAPRCPPSPSASHRQIAIIQDNSDLANAPAAMAQFRALGATTVRVFLPWSTIAPNAKKTRRPSTSTRPTRPPTAPRNGRRLTRSTARAKQYGLTVELVVTGGAPGGPRARASRSATTPTTAFFAWKPNADRLRPVLARGRQALRRPLHAQGSAVGAAADPLLVDLERAELRRGSRAAGDRRLERLLRADDVPQPRERGLEARCSRPATATTRS